MYDLYLSMRMTPTSDITSHHQDIPVLCPPSCGVHPSVFSPHFSASQFGMRCGSHASDSTKFRPSTCDNGTSERTLYDFQIHRVARTPLVLPDLTFQTTRITSRALRLLLSRAHRPGVKLRDGKEIRAERDLLKNCDQFCDRLLDFRNQKKAGFEIYVQYMKYLILVRLFIRLARNPTGSWKLIVPIA